MGTFFPRLTKWCQHQLQIRKEWSSRFSRLSGTPRRIWVHVASVGEYEQIHPVLDALSELSEPEFGIDEFPSVILTHFSPSGEQIYTQVQQISLPVQVGYFPFPLPGRVRWWLTRVNPSLYVGVRYDHWIPYLRAIKRREIPRVCVAGIYTASRMYHPVRRFWLQYSLKWYSHLLVQDVESLQVVREFLSLPETKVYVMGDPRLDRVLQVVHQYRDQLSQMYPRIWEWKEYAGSGPILVGGSVYEPEEQILAILLERLPSLRVILAPHHLDASTDTRIFRSFSRWGILRFSQMIAWTSRQMRKARVLYVDAYGHLKILYGFGDCALVGGGFTRQVHSVLEPLAWEIPVVCGPRTGEFREIRLLQDQAVFPESTRENACERLQVLLDREEVRRTARESIRAFLEQERGAARRIARLLIKILSGEE